jgi:hypothetical protein
MTTQNQNINKMAELVEQSMAVLFMQLIALECDAPSIADSVSRNLMEADESHVVSQLAACPIIVKNRKVSRNQMIIK